MCTSAHLRASCERASRTLAIGETFHRGRGNSPRYCRIAEWCGRHLVLGRRTSAPQPRASATERWCGLPLWRDRSCIRRDLQPPGRRGHPSRPLHLENRAVGRLPGGPRIESCGGVEWWVLEHAGPVLDQLDAAVEGAVVDHLEGDVRVAVVDAFCSRGAGDHRE